MKRIKIMVVAFKKKNLIAFLLCLCLVLIAVLPSAFASSPNKKLKVVVDAGHGGRDIK